MRQLGLRFLTLGKKSTSHGVSLTRNRRSRLSVECLERRDLLAVGTLTGVAYEIDAVTGTNYYGLPYIRSVESTGNLTTASGSLPIQYNEQFPPGYATMNGTVNFTFPQTVTLGQTASISASAQASWNNSGLGFGRPTSIDISDGIGPDGMDNKGSFANGTTSAQVNWSDSVAVPTGRGSITLPTVAVVVDGKEDKIISLTASYQISQAPPPPPPPPASLEIAGVPDAEKLTVGGLVAMSSDSNAAPRAQITIGQSSVAVALSENNAEVSIFTAPTGGSQITFNGTDNVFQPSQLPLNLYVQGVQYSTTMRDVELDATTVGSQPATSAVKFTVLWVSQPTISFAGTVSTADTSSEVYKDSAVAGTLELGLQHYNANVGWRLGWGYEVQATVYPSDFDYPGVDLTLARDNAFHDWLGDGKETIPPLRGFSVLPAANDTSGPLWESIVSSNNNELIFDLDSPGLRDTVVAKKGTVERTRNNFKEFATINLNGTIVRVSPVRDFFVRFSMKQMKGHKGSDWVVIKPPDVKGDDKAGYGSTELTWNLKRT